MYRDKKSVKLKESADNARHRRYLNHEPRYEKTGFFATGYREADLRLYFRYVQG